MEKLKAGVSKGIAQGEFENKLSNIFEIFSKICHGGEKQKFLIFKGARLQTKDIEEVKNKIKEDLSHLNVLVLREKDIETILLLLLGTVNEFASKWNSGSFNFCSCTGFAATIGRASEFAAIANQKCDPPRATPPPIVRPPRTISKSSRFASLAHRLELQALELDQQAATLEESLEE
jgi:hypothetical protein